MSKEAYYFSHDSNARHDPKCSALINDYGAEGYGIFWMIIEILSEQENYKLKKFNKLYEGLAKQIWVDSANLRSIIEAMLHDYELLVEDDEYIWSESLLRRMQLKDDKRLKKVEAGRKGGIKSGVSRSNKPKEAVFKQNEALLQANEPKESKINEIKDKLLSLINLNEIQYEKPEKTELIYSFLNVMDVEVIEDVINRSKSNHINYVLKALRNRMTEGNTNKDTIKPIYKIPSEKEAEVQQRLAEERKNAEPIPFKPEFEKIDEVGA